jgi:hypothetical protein
MTDDDRIAGLIEQVEALSFEAREAFISTLSEEDREAVWAAELEEADQAVPDDDAELGGEA